MASRSVSIPGLPGILPTLICYATALLPSKLSSFNNTSSPNQEIMWYIEVVLDKLWILIVLLVFNVHNVIIYLAYYNLQIGTCLWLWMGLGMHIWVIDSTKLYPHLLVAWVHFHCMYLLWPAHWFSFTCMVVLIFLLEWYSDCTV